MSDTPIDRARALLILRETLPVLFADSMNMCDQMADVLQEMVDEVERLTADRHTLQAAGEHPAPCARHCESTAYEIELRQLRSRAEAAEAKLREFEGVAPVAWMTDCRSVCGEGLTKDLKLAECWAAIGWSVTSLIPIPEMPS